MIWFCFQTVSCKTFVQEEESDLFCFVLFFPLRTYSINKDNYFPFHHYGAFPEERNSNSISGAKKEDVWFSTPQIDCNFS